MYINLRKYLFLKEDEESDSDYENACSEESDDSDSNFSDDEDEFIQKYATIDRFEFTSEISENSFLKLKDGSLFAKKTLLWLMANRTYKLSNDVRDRFIPRRVITINVLPNNTEDLWKSDCVTKATT